MAISLSNLQARRSVLPPRVVLYGPHGMGKTTLAAEFPSPAFIQVEDGTPGDLELMSFGDIATFGDVIGALGVLYSERHDRQTAVIDALPALEKLIWAETCSRNNWKQIEDAGYGKGYVAAEYVWQEFMEGVNALRRDRGMTVVLIGHSEATRFDDPTSQSYSRYEIDLHKGARAMIERDVDAILLIKQDVTIVKEEQGFNKKRNIGAGMARYIHCTPTAAYNAKNRYGMPEKLLFEKGQGFAALAPYFPQTQAAPAAQAA